MDITVYSKPACVQCTATYRWLDKHGLDYEVIDLATDPAAFAAVRALGHLSAPVVIVRAADGSTEDHWSGFRPDRIDDLAARALVAA